MLEEEFYRELRKKREVARYYKNYVAYLLLSLVLTTIGAYFGSYIVQFLTRPQIFACGAISLLLVVIFVLSFGVVKKIIFYIFTFGEGITITPMLSLFTTITIYKCLIATTLIVLSFCILGFKFKDLSFLENILSALIIILIGLTLLDMFVHLSYLSYFGLGVFCLYVMYDINSFKLNINKRFDFIDDDFVLDAVMEVYLDVLNIFKYLLEMSSDDD